AWTSERQRQAALQKAVADSQQALKQATQLYARGLSAYLPVLVAQRSLNQARDALALSQLAQLQGGIALYKALGAGSSDTELVSQSDPQRDPPQRDSPQRDSNCHANRAAARAP
ncbi:MAG TPA: hypothetical protein DHL02_22905, partial [Achromobacter sp.]|nr:hypothetical protein [Achromobacter sp.]